jgi:hypothetical protein
MMMTLRERVFRSDKPVTLVYPLRSHKCDNGAEPRCRIIATSAVKGLKTRTFIQNRVYFPHKSRLKHCIPMIPSSNPSGGSEFTFRSDLLLTARGGCT